jgi:hypothetical protein
MAYKGRITKFRSKVIKGTKLLSGDRTFDIGVRSGLLKHLMGLIPFLPLFSTNSAAQVLFWSTSMNVYIQ